MHPKSANSPEKYCIECEDLIMEDDDYDLSEENPWRRIHKKCVDKKYTIDNFDEEE